MPRPPWPRYGVVLLLVAVAFIILQACLIAANGRASMLAQAVGQDWKSKVSLGLYVVGIASSFVST